MSSTVTSAISPVVTGAGRNRVTTYTATEVTGPIGNPPTYISNIIRYDDARGTNPVTIGSRNPQTGAITWNDNATNRTRLNSRYFASASTGQISSVQSALTSNASDVAALNSSAGQSNTAQGSGNNQSTPTTLGNAVSTVASALSGRGGSSSPLVFPVNIPSDRDTIKLSSMEYSPSGFGRGSSIGTTGTRGGMNTRIRGSVVLPVPSGISDTNAVAWGQDTMNPIQAAAATIALDAMAENKDWTDAVGDAANKIKGNTNVKKGLEGMITGAATGLGAQALQRQDGMVMNPNMELLFSGPQLRSFGFSFTLSPRSAREGQIVIQIIRFFKKAMAVKKSRGNLFLKAPNTFKLEYMSRGRPNPHLNHFKECALQNCTVQYTPDGTYNTYTDGVMTSYSLQLSFNELDPIYESDYTSAAPGIGY